MVTSVEFLARMQAEPVGEIAGRRAYRALVSF